MQPTTPDGLPGRTVVFAKDQPQYAPLPSTIDGDTVWSRWQLTEGERKAILDGACIELGLMTFGKPLQPILLQVQGYTGAS